MEENTTPTPVKKSWYENPGCISLLLVFFFPLGVLLMWVYTNWDKRVKAAVTAFFGFMTLLIFLTPTPENTTVNTIPNTNSQTQNQNITENEKQMTGDIELAEPESNLLTAEEELYVQKIISSSENLSDAFLVIGELADEPLKVYNDDAYVLRLAAAIVTIQGEYTKALEITAPPRFKEVHDNFIKALSLYNDATEEMTYGIDNYDADAINNAADLMEEGTIYINIATAKMEAFTD